MEENFSWQSEVDPAVQQAADTVAPPVTVNSLFLRLHLDGLRQLGVSLPDVLTAWGVPEAAVATMPDRVDIAWSDRFWQAAEAVTGDPCLGLRLAHIARPELHELVRPVVGGSRDLGGALVCLTSLGGMIDERLNIYLELEGDEAVVAQADGDEGHGRMRQSNEYVMAALTLIGSHLTGSYLQPSGASFRHGAPVEVTHLRDHFGSQMGFDQARNAIAFPRSYLALPLVAPSEQQRLQLRRRGDELLRGLPDDGFLREVKATVACGLSHGVPTPARVAEVLGLSERALRTRLRLRGTSLRLVTDGLRRSLAIDYLKSRELSVCEVAKRLGFADSAAFGRAFRRWAGCSPRDYRFTH